MVAPKASVVLGTPSAEIGKTVLEPLPKKESPSPPEHG
jgi:hypothetical protein